MFHFQVRIISLHVFLTSQQGLLVWSLNIIHIHNILPFVMYSKQSLHNSLTR